MKNAQDERYNDIFMKIAATAKKKGGSMAAVFKLIQELLDFEEKIQECMDAQEMSQNKRRIESFMDEIDKMYDVLFQMARGGISNIRDRRNEVENIPEDSESEIGVDEVEDADVDVDVDIAPVSSDKRRNPVMLNVPQVPKM